jgi:hypothetical protein
MRSPLGYSAIYTHARKKPHNVQSREEESKEQKIMSASIDALAMAGADYTKFYRNVDEVDKLDPPPYLWASSNEIDEQSSKREMREEKCVLASLIAKSRSDDNDKDKEEMKKELVLWAKAVAASVNNKFATNY